AQAAAVLAQVERVERRPLRVPVPRERHLEEVVVPAVQVEHRARRPDHDGIGRPVADEGGDDLALVVVGQGEGERLEALAEDVGHPPGLRRGTGRDVGGRRGRRGYVAGGHGAPTSTTTLPNCSPEARRANASRARASGTTESITGRTPLRAQNRSNASRSSFAPIVTPTTRTSVKNTRASSAGGRSPVVAPATTTTPPGRTARSECPHVASPTVSTTASTV